ncbi:MAG TPA: peptidoglycan-binding domain-containing protein [Feifaniaceae bacterium]|nr:peptidoglycan-binding domain-containing protein [Feifaniaceae bacterium]
MVFVFDPKSGDWIMRDLKPEEPMPGSINGMLTVRAFRGKSESPILWTDIRAVAAAEKLMISAKHPVRYAFRRVSEGGHVGQSPHYAGLAFDFGYNLNSASQLSIARRALAAAGFQSVEPLFMTPGWVHAEISVLPPASLCGGYPRIDPGMRGVHVFVLQDALIQHGLSSSGLTGCFSASTAADVRRFQQKNGLPATGAADGATWQALMKPHAPWNQSG